MEIIFSEVDDKLDKTFNQLIKKLDEIESKLLDLRNIIFQRQKILLKTERDKSHQQIQSQYH